MRYPLSANTLERPSGRVAGGIAFGIRDQDDDSEITVYQAAVGATEVSTPESDSNGHPEGFVESGSYYFYSPTDQFVPQNFEAVTARDLGGREIDYAEITSPASGIGAGGVPADVAGLTIDVPSGSRPFEIEVFAPYMTYAGSTGLRVVALYVATGTVEVVLSSLNCNPVLTQLPCIGKQRFDPPDADASYRVQMALFNGAGSCTMAAGAGGDAQFTPAYIQAVYI